VENKPQTRRGPKKKGLKYQRQVQEKLGTIYEGAFTPGQWFRYYVRERRKPQFCELDGLLEFPELSLVVIVEIKLVHTAAAYFQLTNLYRPVLQTFLRGAGDESTQIALLELVRWYDPSREFPCVPVKLENIEEASPRDFNVRIWNPSRPFRKQDA
jgi:hypothetical protein